MKQLKDLNKITYWIFFMLVGIFILSFFTSCMVDNRNNYDLEITYKVYRPDNTETTTVHKTVFCDCGVDLKNDNGIYSITYDIGAILISGPFPLEIVDYKYTKIEEDGR